MAVADEVVVELEARTGQYLGDIRNTRNQFLSNMAEMERGAARMEQRVDSAVRGMGNTLRTTIAAIGVATLVRETVDLGDAWTNAGNKIAAAGVPAERVETTLSALATASRETRSQFETTANTYARLTRATNQLGVSQAQVLQATRLINQATVAGGATTQEQISTITQLTQALASGNLQGDELRSIRENSPLIARAIAAEFNTTIGGLKQLGREGKLTSDRVFQAILAAGPAIEAQFARTRSTVGQSLLALQTEAGRFLHQFDTATGATSGISAFINHVADDFDLLAQAVIVAGATVTGVFVGRFVRDMTQAAAANTTFVRALFTGNVAFNDHAEAALRDARAVALNARADQAAAAQTVAATETRIAALRQEAVAYETNIALATAQRQAAARAAEIGRSPTGQFVSRASAATDRNDATRAVVANRMQLTRVNRELAAAESQLAMATNEAAVAQGRANLASMQLRGAISQTSMVTRAATLAMRGLSSAMAFFGGPIGLAITAVAASLAYLAGEAAKAEQASENAAAVLDRFDQEAGATDTTVRNLGQTTSNTAGDTRDLGTAAEQAASSTANSANEARGAANAYAQMGESAANAAIAIGQMTAAQRQQRLEQVRSAREDLESAVNGNGPLTGAFTTNRREAVANARTNLLRAANIRASANFGGSSEQFVNQAAWAAQRPGASAALRRAHQEYLNAIAVANDDIRRLQALREREQQLFESIDDPVDSPVITVTAPRRNGAGTSTASRDSGGRSRGGGGRERTGPSPEELARQREELELTNRINLARAAGADELATFLQDLQTYNQQVQQRITNGETPEQARSNAQQYIDELRAAREVQRQREETDRQTEETNRLREEEVDRQNRLREQGLFLQDQELQLQLELARLAGDSERVRELERILSLNARISGYVNQGGLTETEARARAGREEGQLNQADDRAQMRNGIRDVFNEGVRAALDGNLGDFFSNWLRDAASRGLERSIEALADALTNLLTGSGVTGKPGTGLLNDLFSAFFGGNHAGGGTARPGSWFIAGENGPEPVFAGTSGARIFPNSVLNNASTPQVTTNIQVINATGTPAQAQVEQSGGQTKITLEPLFDKGISGAGASGKLMKALKASPQPVRRA